MVKLAFVLLLTLAYAQPCHQTLPPRCRDVHFNLATTAANRVATNPPPDLFSDPAATSAFLTQPVAYRNVSGTFTIYGQLCRPLYHSRTPKVQLLVHGSTYNHTYWTALQDPSASISTRHEALSWVHAATHRGYWTLAIDRLGQGSSSRPDPVAVVQDALQTELLYLIAQHIRHDDVLGSPGKLHDGADLKLIYVGHSFGAGLGVRLAAAYPSAFDGYVLTGISTVRGSPQPGSVLARWGPAAKAQPDRFPDASPGYLVSTNKTGRAGLYWGAASAFDAELFERDWAGQGTNPLGEVLTVAGYVASLPTAFEGPVLVADGDEDAIFCSEFGSRDLGTVKCRAGSDGEIAKTREWFPRVPRDRFETYLQPAAGHVQLLHRTGGLLIVRAHEWMASVGL